MHSLGQVFRKASCTLYQIGMKLKLGVRDFSCAVSGSGHLAAHEKKKTKKNNLYTSEGSSCQLVF